MKLENVGMLGNPVNEIAAHTHDKWEYAYYLEGSGTVIVGSDSIPFTAGDLFIKPPHITHAEISEVGFTDIFAFAGEPPLPSNGYIHIRDNAASDIKAMFMMLYRDCYFTDTPDELLQNALCDVIAQRIRGIASVGVENAYVERMRAMLHAGLSDADCSFDRICASLHLNPDYGRRLFRRETGMTPVRYLTALRMKNAAGILRSGSGLSIKDVAEMVGIQDVFYFSKLFKRMYGISPGKWRNAH